MADLDNDFLLDEEEMQHETAFIRKRLPLDIKEKYDEETLRWMLDAIVDYYVSSGILDAETEDDEIDIDMEQVADHICRQAQKEGKAKLDPQDVFFVVEADLDFQEQNLSE